MDCAEVRELLSSFNDREATLEEKAAIEEHLRTCKDCAFESTMIVGLKRLLGHWEGLAATENFKSDLLERVKQEPERPRWAFANLRPVVIGAAAAAGLVVIVLMWLLIPRSRGAAGARTKGARAAVASAGAPEREPPARREGRSGPVAQVLVQEGTLRICRSDGVESLGSAGDRLAPGESLRVPGKGEVELDLGGGLRLRLFSETGQVAEFRIGEGPSEGELASGASFLAGAADARKGDAYSVKTGAALVSFVKRDLLARMALKEDGSLGVTIARGRAEAMLPAGVQALSAEQTLSVAPDGKLTSPAGPAEEGALERLWRWGKR